MKSTERFFFAASLVVVAILVVACDAHPRRRIGPTPIRDLAATPSTDLPTSPPSIDPTSAPTKKASPSKIAPQVPPAPPEDKRSLDQIVKSGRKLFRRKRCNFCHKTKGFAPASGPNLKDVGGRLTHDELHRWIKTPKVFKPDTRMPTFDGSERQLLDIVEFLKTLR